MISIKKIAGGVLILLIAFIGCKDYSELDPPSLDPGELDPSMYVAIGNSITSGFQNNALYESVQQHSYPSLIARQLNIDEFEQPIFEEPGLPARMRVATDGSLVVDPPNINPPVNAQLERPFNNLGIPASVLFDVVDQQDFAVKSEQRENPFFAFILRNQALGESILAQALNLQPTLLTLWTGNNDILGYVVSGGTDLLPTAQNPQFFAAIYSEIGGVLSEANVPVIVANIPDVTLIPFVNTVPPVIINPETEQPITDPEGNPIFYIGVSPGDKVLLTALDYINQGYGRPVDLGGNNEPLPENVVLTVEEQEFAKDVVQTFNSIIANIANEHDFGLVDLHSTYNQLDQDGYTLGEQTLSTEFVTGGLFSLDGVHPTSRGQAIIANEFISVINQEFGASIRQIQVGTIPPSIGLAEGGASKSMKNLLELDTKVFSNILDLYLQ